MADHLCDCGFPPCSYLPVYSLDEIKASGEQFPSPPFISDTVCPEIGSRERRIWCGGVSNEAVGGVGVHTQQERDEEMVSVPESLVGLLADLVMSSGVHQQHAEKHDVSCDATSLSVVNLNRRFRTKLSSLNVEEIDIVGAHVYAGEEEDGVGTLSMEPLRFVKRQPLEFRSNKSEQGSAHWQENEHDIDGENQTGSSG